MYVCVVSIYECFRVCANCRVGEKRVFTWLLEDKSNLWCSLMLPYSQPINNVMSTVCPVYLCLSRPHQLCFLFLPYAFTPVFFPLSFKNILSHSVNQSQTLRLTIIPLPGLVCYPVFLFPLMRKPAGNSESQIQGDTHVYRHTQRKWQDHIQIGFYQIMFHCIN